MARLSLGRNAIKQSLAQLAASSPQILQSTGAKGNNTLSCKHVPCWQSDEHRRLVQEKWRPQGWPAHCAGSATHLVLVHRNPQSAGCLELGFYLGNYYWFLNNFHLKIWKRPISSLLKMCQVVGWEFSTVTHKSSWKSQPSIPSGQGATLSF